MLFRWFGPLRYFARVFTAEDSPRQLALGFALGLVVGLVPKGNLTALLLASILFATRVSLGSGALTAMLFSFIGPWLDPLTHRIGWKILTWPSLQSHFLAFYDRPFVPWTDLNNTVVLGSLVLGVMLFYPAYRLSKPLFKRYPPATVLSQSKDRLHRLLDRGPKPAPESL